MRTRSSVAVMRVLGVVSLVFFTEYVAGCGNDGGAKSRCTSGDQSLCNFYAAIKSKAEAHDVDGFMALVATDYLHNCMNVSQLRTRLNEFLPTVKTFTYNVTSVAMNEAYAAVSATLTITSTTGGSIITWTEPDTTDNSLGLGYLLKSNDQWLVFGDRWRAKPMVQVGYVPDNPPANQYLYGFYVTSSCAQLAAAEVTGTNIAAQALQHDIGSESMSSGTVSRSDPSLLPNVGDPYTFSITYGDSSQQTLNDSVKSVIAVTLSMFVTVNQGVAHITWIDVSDQVQNAASYTVEARLLNNTLIWASPSYPLTQTSTTFGTALQPLGSGQYYFGLTLFDIYEDYTYKVRLVSVP